MKYKKYLLILVLIVSICICPTVSALEKSNLITNNEISNIARISMNDTTKFAVVTIGCDGIFGSSSDPNSLKSIIDDVMAYPKYIIPAIIIGLGTLDLAKAVFAPREDEMKKAQKTFIKRVLIGITIYFVPLIMDIIMYLADLVWNGAFTTCGV